MCRGSGGKTDVPGPGPVGIRDAQHSKWVCFGIGVGVRVRLLIEYNF